MIRSLLKIGLGLLAMASGTRAFSQQNCPPNINFELGALTHWWAYTGNNQINPSNPDGNGPLAIKMNYDSSVNAPVGTIGAVTIPEYNLATVNGIQVITATALDLYGGFTTIPTINGYAYDYAIKLGSTSITHSSSTATGGGYIRGVRYRINVPAQPAAQPYTMTYAYAMVLENGAHPSNEQPMFSATLMTNDSIITCASPKYLLPTFNDPNAQGFDTLDSAAAKQEGFSVSNQPSPNPDPNATGPNPPHLYDVWTKGWTEVTFDLSPYRGQQVTLTFEADNCVPGGHFSYAYIALRNTCAGLVISGDSVACINSNTAYSVPSLAGATYQWSVPSDWTITSGNNTNVINVTVGQQTGYIVAREQNSCANLTDTLPVSTTTPTIPGTASGGSEVCSGDNTTQLQLSGNTGGVVDWISSTNNGSTWDTIASQDPTLTTQNLTRTTLFKALVQHGQGCAVDSTNAVTVLVDPQSVGGNVGPPDTNFCSGQNTIMLLGLSGNIGNIVGWQSSTDSINWATINPLDTSNSYDVNNITTNTYYRALVKDGVCPIDTSTVASVYFFSAPFPQATIDPADTTICYGTSTPLSALISIGTNYSWTSYDSLQGPVSGTVISPSTLTAQGTPPSTTIYVLNIQNAGCPNALIDTFHISVVPPVIVHAGDDTAVVIGQPLQFKANSSDTLPDMYLWSPPAYLNNPDIADPIGIYNGEVDSITYIVKATDALGCFGLDSVTVRVFKTLPDIFVPNAFTPGLAINNIFRPIPVGISKFEYFRVYNRWGQLVYSTSQTGVGWNGSYNGKPQDAGAFVWMAEGIDYTGRTIFRKGTMVLIR